jgi:hypothetical protein
MISDILYENYDNILKSIKHYSSSPWTSDYPNSQRINIIKTLTYLRMSAVAFSHGTTNDTDQEEYDKHHFIASSDYAKAILNSDSDSDSE